MIIQCIPIINQGTFKLLLALAQPCFEIHVHLYESKCFGKKTKNLKNYNTCKACF